MNQGLKKYKSENDDKRYNTANKFQQDLLYLDDLCENSFPQIDSVFPKSRRETIVDSLFHVLSAKNIDEQKLKINLSFYLSHFDNQHTSIITNYFVSGLFPYLLFNSGQHWYLLDINNNYDSLLIGKQIVRIINQPIESIISKCMNYVCAENDKTKRKKIWFLNSPSLLKDFNIIHQTDSIYLTFENNTSIWVRSIYKESDLHFHLDKKRFKPNVITKQSNKHYNASFYPDENYAYFQFNNCFDLIDAKESIPDYVKPWVVPFANLYLKRLIKKKRIPKNDIGFDIDFERPVFKDYLKQTFDSIQKQSIDNLIIDLRHNGGGSMLLCLQLLYYLTDRTNLTDFSEMYYLSEYNRKTNKKEYNDFVKSYELKNKTNPEKGKIYPNGFKHCEKSLFEKIEDPNSPYFIKKDRKVFKGKIIVLAGHNTGSAAALLTTLIQDNNIAKVIGTSVGNNPIGATEYHPFKLPNSKIKGTVASTFLIRPNIENGKIQMPDFWIEYSVDDLIKGKDKSLDKAFELINNQKNASR